ncbi:hypothetical protein BK784_38805 [Bacillus thuringiensis serovar medellin]|uniref:Uncharacterized protein n=1 Tax=Bacillus thuringiensis subsp. medellin TaxID=79672 RepID=A0A9X6MQK8_BACTV|nr:hypothetical protein [Bacillus thuringiensis]OUB82185.1 hypothetical protein BK784_38805 [Bacillus thuringiensis serovar medellin]
MENENANKLNSLNKKGEIDRVSLPITDLKLISNLDFNHVLNLLKLIPNFNYILNSKTGKMDSSKVLKIVNDNPPLTIIKTSNHHLVSSQKVSINSLIELGSSFIGSILGNLYLNSEIKQLSTDLVKSVFIDLLPQNKNPWISFYEASTDKTSYTYNILALFQQNSFLFIVPITFDITVLGDKESIYQFKQTDFATYDVKINLVNILKVLKSFS